MKRGMDSSFDTWRVNGTTIISRESNWGGGRRRGGGLFRGASSAKFVSQGCTSRCGFSLGARRVAEGS